MTARFKARVAWMLSAWIALPFAALAADGSDEWMVMTIDGARVGYSHTAYEERQLAGKTIYNTKSVSKFSIGRLGASVDIGIDVETIEDASGLRQVVMSMSMAQNPTEITARVRGDKLSVKSSLMGRSTDEEREWDPATLSDRQLALLTVEMAGAAEGTTKVVPCYDFTSMVSYEATLTTGPKETIEYRSEKIPCSLVYTENSLMPGMKSTTWVDGQGRTLRSAQPMLGTVEIILELATREEALAAGSASESPDIFIQSVIECDLPIPYPRRVDEVLYRLVPREGVEPDWTVFDTDRRQTLTTQEDGSALVRVNRLEPSQDPVLPLGELSEDVEACRQASSMLQSDDPMIQQLAAEVVGDEQHAWAAAKKLERWVFEHIDKKGMDVAFASAAEVCKERRGDCSEHAVLLAAMCRAAGIPAQVVMGVVYVDGIFGGHAWTEVWIDDWYALDATTAHGMVGAGHLSFGASPMSDDESGMLAFMPVGALLGNVSVEVQEMRFGEATYRANAGQSAYTIDGDRFQHELYGIAFSKPSGWKFEGIDAEGMTSQLVALSAPESNDSIEVAVRTVPYDFRLDSLIETARSSGRDLGPAAAIEVDGHPATKITEQRGSYQRIRVILQRESDTLVEFKARAYSDASAALFDQFLASIDFDVGVFQQPAGSR